MSAVFLAWGVSAAALLFLAAWVGRWHVPSVGILGILIDDRGRFSLTHLQLVLWTLVVLSLLSGVFFGRLWQGVDDPLGFDIPAELLGVMGISVGSAVTASAVKASKDSTVPERVKASAPDAPDREDRPKFGQVFLAEEGPLADRVIDITKFQNFVITVVVVTAYVALAIKTIRDAGSAGSITSLPTFTAGLVTLLGISHAGYVGGKLPTPGPEQGRAPGLTVANRAAPAEMRWRREEPTRR